jgi:hypothetical protein
MQQSNGGYPQLEIHMKAYSLRFSVLFLAGLAGLVATGHANDFGDADVDPRFRAKIVKEKIKMKAADAKAGKLAGNGGASDGDCGSQNIGNVDGGGKIGRVPREVFVFAPNAINLVSGRGCQ